MRKKYYALGLLIITSLVLVNHQTEKISNELTTEITEKTSKKTRLEAHLNTLERELHEFNLQKNPVTGEIPLLEKEQELEVALQAKTLAQNSFVGSSNNTYISRGPTNLGGRTRALKIDLSDTSSNTILAGGVSSGLFRTTNGGANWVKVSANDEIHNVTALVQDPRTGSQNIWYYGTGEWSGNSASLGNAYRGQGIWQSTNGGVSWTQISATDSDQTLFDSNFDYINNLAVHPTTGDLFIAATGKIYSYDGTNITLQLEESTNGVGFTDITIASDGTVYASLDNSTNATRGVWALENGSTTWSRIAQNGNPFGWSSGGNARTVLKTAPSNPNILYALFNNGTSGGIEAGLWRYDASSSTWSELSFQLPDEPGADLSGNDPFAIQGGYDLVINVKPDDENFVVIGGTNVYKIDDITDNSADFVRIGGYATQFSYALYNVGGVEHHPDIHALEFDPHDATGSTFFTGTDGGVHRTTDIFAASIQWQSLNNNYQTYQFYHIAMDPTSGSNAIIGGTQDNGTPVGGTDFSLFAIPDNTTMSRFFGGDGVAVGMAPRNSGTTLQLYYGSQNGNIRTNLPNFRSIRPSGAGSQFVTYFYLDPQNTNALYYAGLSTLYATSDAENVTTTTWTNLGTLPTGERLRTFATTPGAYNSSTSNLFIGGQNGGLFRLLDPQNATSASSAVNITPPGASTAGGTILSSIAIHPTNADIMLVGYANYGIQNIFLTNNATAATPTWTLVERNLSSHSIRSAAIADINGEIVYFIGTARGLYSSSDPTTTDWSIEGQNQMGLALISGLVYRHADQKLLVGTHGNGIFETTTQSLSTQDFNTSSNVTLNVFPNPATDIIRLNGNAIRLNQSVDYQIYNVSGKLIDKGITNNSEIDINRLSNGLYILNVSIYNTTRSLKFIKN